MLNLLEIANYISTKNLDIITVLLTLIENCSVMLTIKRYLFCILGESTFYCM